ncbi:MAG: hypothetical protein OXD35_00340 [Thiotrichales bacterium]|nr:hypothetical protein [Thiotrichales bacterium]
MTDAERNDDLARNIQEHAANEQDIACLVRRLQTLHEEIPKFLDNPEPITALTSMTTPVPELVDQYRAAVLKREKLQEYFRSMGYSHIIK